LISRRTGWLLAVLLAGMVMANVDIAVVNVAAPAIHAGLGASGGELQLVVSGYTLSYAVLLVTGARLGAVRGQRRLFLAGLGLFTLASLGCGLAPGPALLIMARVVQGVGAALIVPQVLSGIQRHFAGPARARAIGLYATSVSVGRAAGQLLGGALVTANLLGSGWRPVFLVNVPIGALLLAAGLRFLPADARGGDRRLDLAGVALLSSALALAVVPLVLGRDSGWPVWTWPCLALSPPALAAFAAWERRLAAGGGSPLLDLHLLARRTVAWGLAAQAGAPLTYFALLFVLALYLQQGLGRTPLVSGVTVVSWIAAFGLAGVLLRLVPSRAVPLLAAPGYLVLALAYLAVGALQFRAPWALACWSRRWGWAAWDSALASARCSPT
jgi:MFS family permease